MARMNAVAERDSIGRQLSPAEDFQLFVAQRAQEFKPVLPSHISVEKFQRTVLTAVASNPDLLQANRRTLWNACMKAAQDGLLPDNREAALVWFNTKVSKRGEPDRWEKHVQYMPMVYGLRKKILQSGEIARIETAVVYQNDHFRYVRGLHPDLIHEPTLAEPGEPLAAYSIAWFKDGSYSFEVMPKAQIEKVRQASKNADRGPWVQWWDEMARKTVLRRHAKSLPMSSDIIDVEARDLAEDARTAATVMTLPTQQAPVQIAAAPEATPIPFADEEPQQIEAAAEPGGTHPIVAEFEEARAALQSAENVIDLQAVWDRAQHCEWTDDEYAELEQTMTDRDAELRRGR